uniref:C-type lectin domain-containing protein n=1 Tax=Oreochromis aureus TaxID=47969 RepID=A0AAZ1Y075_OREAU
PISLCQVLDDVGHPFFTTINNTENQILRCVTVCLGLLCAVLLCSNIGQFIFSKYYFYFFNFTDEIINPSSGDQTQPYYNTLTQEKEKLQNDNDNLTAERDRLEISYDVLSKETGQLKIILSNLTKDKDELQHYYSSLITKRDELKANFSNVKNEKDQLQTSFINLKQERDQFETNYTDMQRKLEDLQTNHNNLTATAEQLQTSYNNLQREKDALSILFNALRVKEVQLESNYTVLKREKDQLQRSYNTLNRNKHQTDQSYNALRKEKEQLQTRYNTLRKEKEQLQTNYSRLATAREELQSKVKRMTTKLNGIPCQAHWRRFDISCYFVSTLKKNWTESRKACIAEGADLLVIDSAEEQVFVNELLDKRERQNTWIGLTDTLKEGVWTWVDGTPITIEYWQPGQPNDFKNQDCGEYVSSDKGSWNDDGCFAAQNYICEK